MQISPENSILIALTKMWDAIVATLYFCLCCLPVITVGASITAVISTMMAISQDECGSVARRFFGTFRREFKLATAAWMLILLAALLLAADIWVCWVWAGSSGAIVEIMRGITVFFAVVLCSVSVFTFAGIAKFVVTLGQAFRNALIFAVKHPGFTLLQLLLLALLVVSVHMANLFAFPVVVLILYLMAKIYVRIFGKFTGEETAHHD